MGNSKDNFRPGDFDESFEFEEFTNFEDLYLQDNLGENFTPELSDDAFELEEHINKDNLDEVFETIKKGKIIENEIYSFINDNRLKRNIIERLISLVTYGIRFSNSEKKSHLDTAKKIAGLFFTEKCEIEELPEPFNNLNLDELLTIGFHTTIIYESFYSEYESIINELRGKYSINDYKTLINLRLPVINKNEELFIISPLILDFDTWKKLVNYELSRLPILERKYEVNKMHYLIHELQTRLDSDSILNIDEFLHFDETTIRAYIDKNTELTERTREINEYQNFLANINTNEIKTYSPGLNEKIYLNPRYKQKDIIKFFQLIERKYNIEFNHLFFITNYFIYKTPQSKEYFIKNRIEHLKELKFDKKTITFLILLIKYFIEKEVIISDKKINSIRKLSRILFEFSERIIGFETIRNELSNKKNLEYQTIMDLNYYLILPKK